jgi:peptide/nickel transport system permease protein
MLSSTREFATDASRRAPLRPAGRFSRARRRLARWGSGGLMGAALLGVLVAVAVIGPLVTSDPLRMDVPVRLQPPSLAHVMGTDQFGRDIFSRVVRGARISLGGGVGVVLVGLGIGLALGVVAAYRGGALGLGVMSLIDVMLSLPGVLLAIVIAALLSPRLTTAIFAVGIVSIPYYARLVWGVTQTIRLREYVEAARAAGASDARIIARHILPGVFPPALVQATLGVGNGILSVSALSFLGVGAQPPTPEWGLMLGEAQRFILLAPHMGIFPGLGIMAAVLSFNLIGDALRDLLDPVLAQVMRK